MSKLNKVHRNPACLKRENKSVFAHLKGSTIFQFMLSQDKSARTIFQFMLSQHKSARTSFQLMLS